jgi:hypothetical protein
MTLPIRPGSARGKGGPAYMLNLAISPVTRSVTRTCPQTSVERLRAGRDPQPAPEPGQLPDREAGQ